jgi:predicted branched-subunit amino acid permease
MTTIQEPRACLGGPRAAAIRDGLGVGLAVGVFGLVFGAAAVTAGLTVAQACVLSLLAFTGASQFALVGVISGGGSLVAGVLGAVLLGGRNALYGLRLSRLLGVRGLRRMVTAHLVIDETTAVATAQPDDDSARAGFTATAVTLYTVWNLTTLLGAAGASRMGDPGRYGLDAVGPAVFLALLWPSLGRGGTERLVALGAVAVAVAATPLLPPGVPIMISAVTAVAGALGRRRAPGGEQG